MVEWKKLGEISISLNKGTLKQGELIENGKYPVINSGISLYGRYNEYNNEGNVFTIASRGEYAGFINYSSERFWAGGLCYPYRSSEERLYLTKYLYICLKHYEKKIMKTLVSRGSIPALNKADVDKILLPIPSLQEQERIVGILDTFTASIDNLKAQIEQRRKQYEHYRDQLLNLEGKEGVEMKTLGEISKYRRGSFPQPYGNREWYDGEGAMPFVQVADVEDFGMKLKDKTKQMISRLAMPKSVFAPKETVIVTLQGSIGKVAITQYESYVDRTLGIFEGFIIEINKKYFAHQLEKIFAIKREKARGGIIKTITKEEFTNFPIPLPSLQEQERIVGILDTFEASIQNLEAQLEQRQKQYEFYREKLLTFE